MKTIDLYDKTVTIDNFLVRRYGSNKVIYYSVWEKGEVVYTHSTITSFGGGKEVGQGNGPTQWYGRLGTRELSKDINSIPVGPERYKAVDIWHNAQYNLAYDLINKAFPETINNGVKSMGEIELYL